MKTIAMHAQTFRTSGPARGGCTNVSIERVACTLRDAMWSAGAALQCAYRLWKGEPSVDVRSGKCDDSVGGLWQMWVHGSVNTCSACMCMSSDTSCARDGFCCACVFHACRHTRSSDTCCIRAHAASGTHLIPLSSACVLTTHSLTHWPDLNCSLRTLAHFFLHSLKYQLRTPPCTLTYSLSARSSTRSPAHARPTSVHLLLAHHG